MGVMYKLLKHRQRHSDRSDGDGDGDGNQQRTGGPEPSGGDQRPGNRMSATTAPPPHWSGKCGRVAAAATRRLQQQRIITLDGRIEEAALVMEQQQQQQSQLAAAQEAADKEFTAEHILQLCRFLAERAKKNKNLCKTTPLQQQTPRRPEAEPHSIGAEGRSAGEEARLVALPLLAVEGASEKAAARVRLPMAVASAVLMDKLAAGQSQPGSGDGARSHAGGKRDILLKIRRQIFERKRQRQLARGQQQRYGVGAAAGGGIGGGGVVGGGDGGGGCAVWRPW